MTEKCYRLSSRLDTVEVRGTDAMTALTDSGWLFVAEIDCTTGTVTAQADPKFVAQGEADRAVFESLPDEEIRQLRRQVGGVQVEPSGQSTPW